MNDPLAEQIATDLGQLKLLAGRMAERLDQIAGALCVLNGGSLPSAPAPTRRVCRRSPKRDLVLQLIQQRDEGFSSAEIFDLAEQVGQPLKPSTITSVLSTEARAGRLMYGDGRYRLPPVEAEEAAGA